jgi:hypothetical protein
MSFQDIGRKPTERASAKTSLHFNNATNVNASTLETEQNDATSRDSYATVSQLILQYQVSSKYRAFFTLSKFNPQTFMILLHY